MTTTVYISSETLFILFDTGWDDKCLLGHPLDFVKVGAKEFSKKNYAVLLVKFSTHLSHLDKTSSRYCTILWVPTIKPMENAPNVLRVISFRWTAVNVGWHFKWLPTILPSA